MNFCFLVVCYGPEWQFPVRVFHGTNEKSTKRNAKAFCADLKAGKGMDKVPENAREPHLLRMSSFKVVPVEIEFVG